MQVVAGLSNIELPRSRADGVSIRNLILFVASRGESTRRTIEKVKHQLLDQILDKFSIDLIALTRGEEGSLLYSKKERREHDGYFTSVVDTVGAET